MTADAPAPIVVRRKRKAVAEAHHGGAWKVAYADFVTAMMAFFMLMWLLNATTEQQRKGLADYFSPSVPISRTSGGGEGVFSGSMLLSETDAPLEGVGGDEGRIARGPFESEGAGDSTGETVALEELREALIGTGGESLLSDEQLAHVVTRVTDEGLVIEVFALPDAPIFDDERGELLPMAAGILESVAAVSTRVVNPLAVSAHMPRRPVVLAENPVFDLTQRRSVVAREALARGGIVEDRFTRLTAHGDRTPAVPDASAPRNDRFEIILLRTES